MPPLLIQGDASSPEVRPGVSGRPAVSAWVRRVTFNTIRIVRCAVNTVCIELDAEQSLGDIESEDMQTGGVMVIPACCIQSIERLEEVETLTFSWLPVRRLGGSSYILTSQPDQSLVSRLYRSFIE